LLHLSHCVLTPLHSFPTRRSSDHDELLGPPYSSPVGGVVGSSSRHACDTANDQEDSSCDTITVPRRQTGPHRVGMGFVFLVVYSPHTSAGISDVVPSR